MDNKHKECTACIPYGLPAAFTIFYPLGKGDGKRVIKHLRGNLKANAMFAAIYSSLVPIPRKFTSHCFPRATARRNSCARPLSNRAWQTRG